jgi:glycosyltransferase involved in cell wall biosynthesis
MGQYHATAHIRLLLPLRHPRFGKRYEIFDGLRLPEESFDVVILERFWHNRVSTAEAQRLVREIRRRSHLFLYSIDDSLLDATTNTENWTAQFGSEQQAAVLFFARAADGIIVSTDALKNRLRALNDRIVVVANALDERLFQDAEERLTRRLARDHPGGPTKFGYLGTGMPLTDLMVVVEPLRQILRDFGAKVEFQLAGVTTAQRAMHLFAGLPVKPLTVSGVDHYPEFVRWAAGHLDWDFGIAPLADVPLNRCKSDIKFLDYSLLGIPAVCSDVPAYRNTVKHMSTGLVTPEDPQGWRSALKYMITKPAERARMALEAYRETRATRTLQRRAHEWREAIDMLWEKCAHRRAVSAG